MLRLKSVAGLTPAVCSLGLFAFLGASRMVSGGHTAIRELPDAAAASIIQGRDHRDAVDETKTIVRMTASHALLSTVHYPRKDIMPRNRYTAGKMAAVRAFLRHASTPYQAGWPIEMRVPKEQIQQSLVAFQADMSDAAQELYLGLHDGVYAWSADGALKDGWPASYPDSENYRGVSIMMEDGVGKIACATVEPLYDPRTHVFTHEGVEAPGWPNMVENFMPRSPTWTDLHQDGVRTLVGVDGVNVYAWYSSGSEAAGWPQALDAFPPSGLAAGDVDNDGNIEIVVSKMTWASIKHIYVLSPEGQILYDWQPENATTTWSDNSPVLADLDQDGDMEIIITGFDDLYVYHHDGTPMWPGKKTLIKNAGPAAVADLDDDGQVEVVVKDEKNIYVWDADGQPKAGWPLFLDGYAFNGGDGSEGHGPAIGDIDADGEQEIVVNVIHSDTGNWCMLALNPDGSMVQGFPLTEGLYDPYGTPVITDLDGDGDVELCAYGMEYQRFGVPYDIMRMVVYDLPAQYDPMRVHWPMFQHDAQRTGCFKRPEPAMAGR